MKQTRISHQLVEFIPEQLAEGVLYVSMRYGTAMHKCCCGCGEEVVTPLNPTDWSIDIDRDGVTLNPSIGNWSYACRSHYFIRQGRIVWAGDMTRAQIEASRQRDLAEKAKYFESVNSQRLSSKSHATTFAAKVWKAIRSLWK